MNINRINANLNTIRKMQRYAKMVLIVNLENKENANINILIQMKMLIKLIKLTIQLSTFMKILILLIVRRNL